MKVLVSAGEKLLHNTLRRFGYEVIVSENGTQALERLFEIDGPKVAIINWEMKDISGAEVCKTLRRGCVEPYIYTILLTSKSQKDELLDVFEFGADDYLVKPFDGYELRAKLIVAKRILDLQDRLVSMREDLRARATHDSLTGLWNRQATMEALAREIDRSTREGKPCGLILADVDHFKLINDAFGHQAGDEVLKETAGSLCAAVRPYDVVGRYGGEEFLVIAPGCNSATIVERAEEVRSDIESKSMRTSKGNISITLSLGAIAAMPGSDLTTKSLIRSADEALYLAKRGGRNRVELARI
jgi:two-component system cell cycle response regulator